VCAVILGTLACGKESSTPTQLDNAVVHVQRSEGVDGTPQAGDLTVTKSANVSYAFTAQPTHSDLIVTLDNKPIAPSGTFAADSTRRLVATATRKPLIAPEDAPIITSANAIETQSDPVAALTQHISTVNTMFAKAGVIAGSDRLAEVERQAAATSSVPDARRRSVHSVLGGHTFWLSPTSSGLAPSNVADAAAAAPVTFLYVNGILSAPANAAGDAKTFEQAIVGPAGFLADKVGLFYNSSWLYNGTNLSSGCLLPLVDQLGSSNTALVYEQLVARCIRTVTDVFDVGELLRQMLEVSFGFKSVAEPDAKILAAAILQEIDQGRRVIVVAHSQGNLMTQQALNTINQTAFPGLNPLPCIGVMRYAPPVSSNWTVASSDHLAGFVLEGDITRLLGQNGDLAPVQTARSSAWLALGQFIGPLGQLIIPAVIHFARAGYMLDPDAKRISIGMIQALHSAVTAGAGCDGAFKVILASSGQSDGGPPSNLFLVSPASDGKDQLVGRLRTATGDEPAITDLAWCPGSVLYGISYDDLYQISASTGALTRLGTHGRVSANALTCAPNGDLYLGASGSLYRFSSDRKSNTLIGSTGLGVYSGDIAFNRTGTLFGTLRTGESADVLVQVDVATGRTTRIGTIGFSNVWGITFVGDVLYGLTTSSSGVGSLIQIDTRSGTGTRIRSLAFQAFGSTLRAQMNARGRQLPKLHGHQ
jgi:hypothetical protein